MGTFPTISREDLIHWADKSSAPGVLPALVRRLLLATTTLTSIDMRADSGVWLGGCDGEVAASEESPWCPAGS
jgi:hypothetical protein